MKQDILIQTKEWVTERFSKDTSGHDIYHIRRVYHLASKIAQQIPEANSWIVKMGALLHDAADHKLTDSSLALKEISEFLSNVNVSPKDRDQLLTLIPQISYSANKPVSELSLEAKIIQDADRLDALGAMGIARAFAYGGHAKQAMMAEADFSKQRGGHGTSVSHFYDKLLRLPDTLHTKMAKKIADKRVMSMQNFLTQLENEWFSNDF